LKDVKFDADVPKFASVHSFPNQTYKMSAAEKDPNFYNILNNKLSIERTKLSNERTFLAYLRTAVTLFGAGVTIIQLKMLKELYEFGIACLVATPIVLGFAIFRFLYNRKRFNRLFELYDDDLEI